jgi:biofilm PGA synthesis N-glycosyltransferase PgaC
VKEVFWISGSVVVLAYLGYPIILCCMARLWSVLPQRKSIFPMVTILLAVRNEETNLVRKLKNLAALDYPPERLEIVVVSDGSTDGTNDLLSAWQGPSRRIIVLSNHAGKAGALNHGLSQASGEIVLFTDARPILAADSLRRIAENFADPMVGCVSGHIILGDPENGAKVNGLGLYWQIESHMRRWEGALGRLVGAAGCLYAVRKSLITPFPAETILDDVYLPAQVARQGKKVIFDSSALGWDSPQDDKGREFRRKVRTITGNYQMLRLAPWILTTRNPIRFQFFCHKILRLLAPFAFGCLLVSSLCVPGPFYRLALVVQLCGYGSALLAFLQLRMGVVAKVGEFALSFIVLNAAAVVALFYFITGKKQLWAR